MGDISIRVRILIPLALSFALLLGVFILNVNYINENNIVDFATRSLHSADMLHKNALVKESSLLNSIISTLVTDPSLSKAVKEVDKEAILDRAGPLYKILNKTIGVTHFYINNPDNINILRVHRPAKSGGPVKHYVLEKISKTGKPFWGVEIGKYGELTLRVAQPWIGENGEVIGYLELGKEIDDVLAQIKDVLKIDLYTMIYKDFLDRKKWEEGLKSAGKTGDWDRFQGAVIVGQTIDAVPELLSRKFAKKKHQYKDADLQVEIGDSHYYAGFISIYNARGEEVGDIVALTDITRNLHSSRASVNYISLFATVLGVTLVSLFFLILGRIETELKQSQAGLKQAHDELEEKVKVRTSALEEANISLESEISRHKKAREELAQLAAAVEQSAETVVITDTVGSIVYVNPAFEETTGYSKAEAIGKNPKLLQSGKQSEAFYKKLWETISGGKVWSGRFINKRKNGSLFEEEATISPVFDTAGQIINYIAIKSDITKSAQLSKAKELFTTITSHELATPLTKLRLVKDLLSSFSENLPTADELGQIKQALDVSYDDLERIDSTTSMLAHLSHSLLKESGQQVYLYTILTGCVDRSVSAVKKEDRNIEVILDVGEFSNEAVTMGDHALVQRAIEEMLSNAVKFTPDGRNVHVKGTTVDGAAKIEIRDEGAGLPPEKVEQIFEPFFSLEDPDQHSTGKYKYKGGGMGLGLTITRLIMEYHGGTLNVKSEGEGKGTVVTLKFPLD